jgi:hypothetical protein
MKYAIRYDSRSTVNGEPVGQVYALDIDHISPGCWSHSKTAEKATQFNSWDDADRVVQRHRWHGAQIVEVK